MATETKVKHKFGTREIDGEVCVGRKVPVYEMCIGKVSVNNGEG